MGWERGRNPPKPRRSPLRGLQMGDTNGDPAKRCGSSRHGGERQRETKTSTVAKSPWARHGSASRAATSTVHVHTLRPPPQLFLFIFLWLLIAPSSVYCVTPSAALNLPLLLQVLAVLLTFNVEC